MEAFDTKVSYGRFKVFGDMMMLLSFIFNNSSVNLLVISPLNLISENILGFLGLLADYTKS